MLSSNIVGSAEMDQFLGLHAPRSPDLHSLDFYFWGHIQSLVNNPEPANVNELWNRIQAAMDTIRNNPEIS
jgi:hypothetical protein